MENINCTGKITEEDINTLTELSDDAGRRIFARLDPDKLMNFMSKHIDTAVIWEFLKDENNYIDGKIIEPESMSNIKIDKIMPAE